MKKRLLSALCAVMLLICAIPMASAQTGDAARRADALTVLHLLSEDPSRDLTKPATRAQAAVLLVRLAFSTMVQFCTGFPVPSLSTPEIFTVILFHQ